MGDERDNVEPPTGADVSLPLEVVQQRIFLIRGQKVMLDADLADLYRVATKVLVQAVKRNASRFPADFMFQLDAAEFADLRSQFVTSSGEVPAQRGILRSRTGHDVRWGGRRTPPHAFTEQGVAMLSSVLRSPRAVAVNIAVMRAFVQMRELLASSAELARRIDELERRMVESDAMRDGQVAAIFEALRQLANPPRPSRRPLGFAVSDPEGSSADPG